jgi:DNA repair exonuclease SbcCD ATPase subunit
MSSFANAYAAYSPYFSQPNPETKHEYLTIGSAEIEELKNKLAYTERRYNALFVEFQKADSVRLLTENKILTSKLAIWERTYSDIQRQLQTATTELTANLEQQSRLGYFKEQVKEYQISKGSDCPICWNKLKDEDIILNCGHLLCLDCCKVDKCPLCRMKI